MYAESVVLAVPQCHKNVQDTLTKATVDDMCTESNAVPDNSQGAGDFIQLMADKLHEKLTSQGFSVPRFNSER